MTSKQIHIAALSACPVVPALAELRSIDFGAAAVQVDGGLGVIRNCAVMTVGPTLGHPFSIDAVTLMQAQNLINAQADGVKVRFKHPGAVKAPDGTLVMADDAGSVVGRLMPTTRVVGNCLRGDIQLGDYAANLPGQGDAKAYLMGIANDDPQSIGLSVVMAWTPDRSSDGAIVARVNNVMACDFVGKPAANPNGLLSAIQTTPAADAPGKTPQGPQPGKKNLMDPKLKAHLVAMGMDPDASDEAAMAFHAGLSPTSKTSLAAKCAAGTAPAAPAAANADPGDETPPAPAPKKKPATAAAAAVIVSATDSIVSLEARRVNEVTQLGAILKVDAKVVNQQIAAGADAGTARVAFLSALTEANKPFQGAAGSVRVGQDAHQVAMLQAIPEGIALRAGYAKIEKPHELAAKFRGISMLDMGRQYLVALGASPEDVTYIPRTRMVELLMSRRELRRDMPQVAMLAESVGDFPSLLLDAINKTFRPLYLDAPKTWPVWVRRASNADFKNINRVALSEAGSLKVRDAAGQINYVTVTDGKESYSLSEYVGGLKITRKGMINDDLDAFGRLPQLQANSAWRAEEEAVYGILTANANLGVDGVALFASGHKNIAAGGGTTGGVPGTGTMTATEALMLQQKGPGGKARLALEPKFIITPVALKRTTQGFLTSADLISVVSTTSSAPQVIGSKNVFAGQGLTHVYSPVLDDTSTAVWYVAADYRAGQIDTIEICFLDGEPEPVLRQETDFDTEDVKFAVRHTLAAKAIDFRGLARNPGS